MQKLFFPLGRAIRAQAVNRDFVMFRFEPFRQLDARLRFGRQIHIVNRVAGIAVKMAMLVHVRAKARRAAVQRHLPGQAALYQRVEAVVNRRVRNLRHRALGADENLLGGRMIALLEQHVINLLPLRREPETARVQPLGQTAIQIFLDHAHRRSKISMNPKYVKI